MYMLNNKKQATVDCVVADRCCKCGALLLVSVSSIVNFCPCGAMNVGEDIDDSFEEEQQDNDAPEYIETLGEREITLCTD